MKGWGGREDWLWGSENPLFLVLGLGVSPVRLGLLGTFSMGPQNCGFGPVRSQWPTQAPPRPCSDLCWYVLNPKSALACLQPPSLSSCASSLPTWCPWPRVSCKALSSSAIWVCCQCWVGASAGHGCCPAFLSSPLSKSPLWGDAPLCLVPIAGAVRMLEIFLLVVG